MRANLKRDLYIQILKLISEKCRNLQLLTQAEVALQNPLFEPERRGHRAKRHREMTEANDEFNQKFQEHIVVACVTLPDLARVMETLSLHLARLQSSQHKRSKAAQMHAESMLFQDALNELGHLARRDIGEPGEPRG
jgi:hypothetical protein